MINFVFFCFAVIGMTNIIVDSNLFEPVREFFKKKLSTKAYEVFNCHQCCGTWVGFFCSLMLILFNYNWLNFIDYTSQLTLLGLLFYLLYSLFKLLILVFLAGCVGSFLSSTHYIITELILSKTSFSLNYEEDVESKISE